MTKVKIPLLRFAYLNYRRLKKRSPLIVSYKGKMSQYEWDKISPEFKLVTDKSLTGKK